MAIDTTSVSSSADTREELPSCLPSRATTSLSSLKAYINSHRGISTRFSPSTLPSVQLIPLVSQSSLLGIARMLISFIDSEMKSSSISLKENSPTKLQYHTGLLWSRCCYASLLAACCGFRTRILCLRLFLVCFRCCLTSW